MDQSNLTRTATPCTAYGHQHREVLGYLVCDHKAVFWPFSGPKLPEEARTMDKTWHPYREMMGYRRWTSRAVAPYTVALVFDPEEGDPTNYAEYGDD